MIPYFRQKVKGKMQKSFLVLKIFRQIE